MLRIETGIRCAFESEAVVLMCLYPGFTQAGLGWNIVCNEACKAEHAQQNMTVFNQNLFFL